MTICELSTARNLSRAQDPTAGRSLDPRASWCLAANGRANLPATSAVTELCYPTRPVQVMSCDFLLANDMAVGVSYF